MADTKNRIVAATSELFRRHGYHGTSLKAVIEASGTPNGSLYHYFPAGKDELAAEVITTTGATYLELFHAIADGATDAGAMITDFFDGAAMVLDETDFIDICPIGTVAREVASTNEPLRLATDAVFDTWITAASARFEAEGIAGDDAAELAATVVAALEGGFMLARAARDTGPLRAIGRQTRRLVEASLVAVPAEPTTVRPSCEGSPARP